MPKFVSIVLAATAVWLAAACAGPGVDSGAADAAARADSLRRCSDSLVEAARDVPPMHYRDYFGRALELRREAAGLSADSTDAATIEYLESRMQMIDTLYSISL